jgi:hypothetical protein
MRNGERTGPPEHERISLVERVHEVDRDNMCAPFRGRFLARCFERPGDITRHIAV